MMINRNILSIAVVTTSNFKCIRNNNCSWFNRI